MVTGLEIRTFWRPSYYDRNIHISFFIAVSKIGFELKRQGSLYTVFKQNGERGKKKTRNGIMHLMAVIYY